MRIESSYTHKTAQQNNRNYSAQKANIVSFEGLKLLKILKKSSKKNFFL